VLAKVDGLKHLHVRRLVVGAKVQLIDPIFPVFGWAGRSVGPSALWWVGKLTKASHVVVVAPPTGDPEARLDLVELDPGFWAVNMNALLRI